jgi:acyl-CoA-dependent ceramide synthase
MVGWMKWQIFIPLLLLQFLNIFWYFLIWRIFLRYVLTFIIQLSFDRSHRGKRAVMGSSLKDERSDDEGSDDESSALKKKRS